MEYWTTERCYITEYLNDASTPDVSVARCRVEPGVTTELHALDVLEWYVIESGRGRMYIGHSSGASGHAGDDTGNDTSSDISDSSSAGTIDREDEGSDGWFDVTPADAFQIPANAPQQITNISDEDLVFLCVCVPRFTPECYTSLEPETHDQ